MDGKPGNAVRMFPLLSPLLPGRPMPGSPMPGSPSFPPGPAAASRGGGGRGGGGEELADCCQRPRVSQAELYIALLIGYERWLEAQKIEFWAKGIILEVAENKIGLLYPKHVGS